MFEVAKKIKANRKNFIIDFGTQVTKYEVIYSLVCFNDKLIIDRHAQHMHH
jgi:hypothetical protein